MALPPDPAGSVPAAGKAASDGLRTLPPRENGVISTVKQLTQGSKLYLPVFVDGALFSTGDGHFAQGDGEVCVTAVNMAATVSVRFKIHSGEAARKNIRAPRFSHSGYFNDPKWAAPRNFIGTMGMPLQEDGTNESENLTLACRNALLRMIELLQDRGWSRRQAYAICSVAVDMRISNVVDVPELCRVGTFTGRYLYERLAKETKSMSRMSRREICVGAATGAAGLVLGGAGTPAEAQFVYRKPDWDVAAFDKLVHDPAHAKQVFDIIIINDGKFLNSIKNSLNGLHFSFGLPDNNIRILAGLHGPANMLAYDDALWSKYQIGDWLKVTDPSTGQPATRNPFRASAAIASIKDMKYASEDPDSFDSIYQDTSVQALQHRGVVFLSCHTALEEQARTLIQRNKLKQDPEEVVHDMMSHVLPDVVIMASMGAAIALLQIDGHYSYITL